MSQQQARKSERAAAPQTSEAESYPQDEATSDMLDEIDEVLEVNAAEFVKAFVQKGGE